MLPLAIEYGMSVDEFWKGEPDLFWAYRFSYFNKLKNQQDTYNFNAWLQGAYFHEAVSVALCNAFSKTKVEYSNKPYEFKSEEDTNEKAKKENEILIAKLKGRVSQVQSILKEKSSTTTEGNTEGGEKINE